jgi:hypothetical protein
MNADNFKKSISLNVLPKADKKIKSLSALSAFYFGMPDNNENRQ